MIEERGGLGAVAVAALAVGCCAGLSLVVAAGLSVGLLAVVGGLAVGLVGLTAAALAVIVRRRRRGGHETCPAPSRENEVSLGNARHGGRRQPLVEVLYFDGCPNHVEVVALVERLSGELGLDPEVRLVNVPDPDTAERERFLGSPTIRVDGRDVEPGAAERTDFVLSCRVYRTRDGLAGQPSESWVREALEAAARPSPARA